MNSMVNAGERRRFKHVPPLMYIFLSFAVVIFIGSILLVLPISSSDMNNSLSYINAFFLSVSAVCVTGLSPVASIGETLSVFGKIVIGILIQVGGLGLVTIVSFIIVATGKRFNMSTANIVKESLNQSGFGELRKLLVHIVIITAVFELAGTLVNLIVFAQDYPFWEALGISVFHSISSFNNAGFDIIGSTSMIKYKDNVLLNLSTCFLILAGGLGFLIYEDVFAMRKWRKFSIQTKIVLITNGLLVVISFFLVKLLQGNSITWLQAFFYSVNLRTAGFTTFDVGSTLNTSTSIISAALMFIGGSPLSTAGGIKTTTFFVIVSTVAALCTGKKPIVYRREISRETIRRAFILFFLGIIDIFSAVFILSIIEGSNFSLAQLSYECFSAFGTVGLSMGITTQLSSGSKIVLCLLMYFGRLGPVTMLTMWTPLFKSKANALSYLSTDISIG